MTAMDYRTTPDAWQTRLWARVIRRLGRRWVISRHVRNYCRPLTITGVAGAEDTHGPAVIIVNHSSHFDTPVALSAIPERLRARTAVAAAADRFYRQGKRGWGDSLFFNAFPIERRGGGAGTLKYPLSLLRRGWSLLIYPEGTRSATGELGQFHHGVTFLAQQARVPVIPIFIEGLRDVMPKGERAPRPGPVFVRLGRPVWLDDAVSVADGTVRLERAMHALAGLEAPHKVPA